MEREEEDKERRGSWSGSMSAAKLIRNLSTRQRRRRRRRASKDTSLPFQETTEMQDPRFEAFRVPGPADGLFYIHDFISEAEEDHLVKSPSPSPRARAGSHSLGWSLTRLTTFVRCLS
jgi:hypothetical protein